MCVLHCNVVPMFVTFLPNDHEHRNSTECVFKILCSHTYFATNSGSFRSTPGFILV
jgi:hypothetical protein